MAYPSMTRRSSIALLLGAAVLISTAGAATDRPVEEAGYDIIVVAGQSNAVGRGEGPYADTFDLPQNNKKIFQLRRRMSDTFEPLRGDGDVIPAKEPLEFWYNFPNGIGSIGFSLPFSRRYAAELLGKSRKILIIPAAKVGSSIRQWDNELDNCRGDLVQYYPDMLRRIDIALSQPGVNRIVALHWQQGEDDINDAVAAIKLSPPDSECIFEPTSYGERLRALIKNFQATYSNHRFPILIGEPMKEWITDDARFSIEQKKLKAEFVDQIHRAAQPSNGVLFVNSKGLIPNKRYGVHFDAASQVRLGAKRFNVYRRYLNGIN